jgi:ABC-2 type transport system ATP-binding protein
LGRAHCSDDDRPRPRDRADGRWPASNPLIDPFDVRAVQDTNGDAVVVHGLRKAYGPQEAVAGVDFTIRRGEVFGLLGPNGAGKTTIVEILEGHRRRSAGDISVLGFDPEQRERSFRERIGIVPQEGGVDPVLTVSEVISLYSAAYPHPRPLAEIVELVGLEEKRDARVETLSGGQRRRLDFALGIAGDPELLFLDEPTTGFDPSARRRSWDAIDRLRSLGKTILLTTHYMEEAQQLADRVAVLASGRIVSEGVPENLAGRAEGTALVSFRTPDGIAWQALPLPRRSDAERRNGHVSFHTEAATRDLLPLVMWAAEHGRELEGLTVTRPSLEDVYLELTEGEES